MPEQVCYSISVTYYGPRAALLATGPFDGGVGVVHEEFHVCAAVLVNVPGASAPR